jgi:hypothetical protein
MKDEDEGDDVQPPPPYMLEAEDEMPQPQPQPQAQTQPQLQGQFQSTLTPAASTVAVMPVVSPPSEQPNQYQSTQYQPTLLSPSPSTTRPNQHYWRPVTPSSHTEQQQQHQQPYQDYSSSARPTPQPKETVQPSNAAHLTSPSEGLSQMESPYTLYLGAYHSTQTPTGVNTTIMSNLPNVVGGAGYNQNPLVSATAATTTNMYTPTLYGSSSSPGAPSSYSGPSGSGYPPNQPSSGPGMYAPTAYRAQPQSPPPTNPNTSGPGAGMYPLTQHQDYSRNSASANYGTYNQIPSQSAPSAYTGSAYPSSQPQSPPEQYRSPPITNVARPGQGLYAPTQLHSSPPGSYPNTPTLPGVYDPTSPTSGIGAHVPTTYTHTPFLLKQHQLPPLPNVAQPGPYPSPMEC